MLGYAPPRPLTSLLRAAKPVVNGAYELFRRISKRRLRMVLFSPDKALKSAISAPAPSISAMVALKQAHRHGLPHDGNLSVHENVISYPLVQTSSENRLGDYFLGGLAADAIPRALIEKAIHYNGVAYCQSLPAFYCERFAHHNPLRVNGVCLFGGILFNHYGHFVSEALGRLYAYPDIRETDPYVLYYAPWGRPRYLEKTNYVGQVLAGFGIPANRLIFLDRFTVLKEVVIPAQRYGFGFMHKPDKIFIDFVRSFRFHYDIPKGLTEADRVYVSRTGLPRKRGAQIGEQSFENYLAGEGYKIFHPENYTLLQQLSVYSRAKKLIFSEGSAVLSCILLPDLDAEVAILCRRRDPHRNIRVSTDCLQGYGNNVLWIDAVRGQYQFGLETWDALVDINWHEASELLRQHGFVKRPLETTPDEDHLALVKSELREFLDEIAGNRKFLEYMVKQEERIPPWEGPSHLIDPRDGRRIWPVRP